jgi:hypothetical protein
MVFAARLDMDHPLWNSPEAAAKCGLVQALGGAILSDFTDLAPLLTRFAPIGS